MGEFGLYLVGLEVEMAETNLQQEKEKILSICEAGVVLTYHPTPFICNLCQAAGMVFPPDQVMQYVWEELVLRVGGADGWDN